MLCRESIERDENLKQENAIEVKDITKNFRVYLDKGHTLKEKALFSRRRKYEIRQVLKGISFEVKRGEAIGLVGHNGCGKSTTLKLLTRIMYPDSGSIEMRGRVSSLIELGAGFHPDMSGRQNIYTNASIFGLTKREIDERMERIIEFSELEEFIDNPVRTYSSGMYMRLAFAVAINVDADILLIDEILAVGDAAFQAKCFNKLRKIKAEGATIVIVSHALSQIEEICERSIWIHDGEIREEGVPREVHKKYLKYMGQEVSENPEVEKEIQKETSEEDSEEIEQESKGVVMEAVPPKRWGNEDAVIQQVFITDMEGNEKKTFEIGEAAKVVVPYTVKKIVPNARFGIAFYKSPERILCYGTNTAIDKRESFFLKNDGNFTFVMDSLPLLAGTYDVDVSIETTEGEAVDFYQFANQLTMNPESEEVGLIQIKHTWKYEEENCE